MEKEEIRINCERAESLMGEYLDGRLDESDKKLLLEHIMSCDACRAEFEKLEKTVALLARSAEEVPNELYASVMKKIKAEKKRTVPMWKKFGTACAAALIVVVAGAYAFPKFMHDAADDLSPASEEDRDMPYSVKDNGETDAPADPEIGPVQTIHIPQNTFLSGEAFDAYKNMPLEEVQSGTVAIVKDKDRHIAFDLLTGNRVELSELVADIGRASEYLSATIKNDSDFYFTSDGVIIEGEYTFPWDMIPEEVFVKYRFASTPLVTDHITK